MFLAYDTYTGNSMNNIQVLFRKGCGTVEIKYMCKYEFRLVKILQYAAREEIRPTPWWPLHSGVNSQFLTKLSDGSAPRCVAVGR